jgi:uncharacterized protein (TIGR02996 family)
MKRKPLDTPPPPVSTIPHASNASLEAAILENPDDDAPYLVYADWLMAEGDPRGELIVMQHDADEADGARKTTLKRAVNAHLAKHVSHFYGPLARFENGTFKALWRYGYVRRLELQWKNGGMWPDSEHAFDELVAILRHPSYQFVVDLLLGPIYDESYDIQFQEVIDVLADLHLPAGLRTLDIGVERVDRLDTAFGEMSHLVAALPRLRRVRLRERRAEHPRPDDPLQEMMIQRSRKRSVEEVEEDA